MNVGRTGEFVESRAGRHRLSIATILDLERVPVRVCVRHERWQRCRAAVATARCAAEFDGDCLTPLEEDVRGGLDRPDLRALLSGSGRSDG